MLGAGGTRGMVIDVRNEQLLDLAEVARSLPVNGRKPHLTTVWRWTTKGCRPRGGGERVRLETIRLGSRTVTTREAFERFLAALKPAGDDGATLHVEPRSPRQRQTASERAARELARRCRRRSWPRLATA